MRHPLADDRFHEEPCPRTRPPSRRVCLPTCPAARWSRTWLSAPTSTARDAMQKASISESTPSGRMGHRAGGLVRSADRCPPQERLRESHQGSAAAAGPRRRREDPPTFARRPFCLVPTGIRLARLRRWPYEALRSWAAAGCPGITDENQP